MPGKRKKTSGSTEKNSLQSSINELLEENENSGEEVRELNRELRRYKHDCEKARGKYTRLLENYDTFMLQNVEAAIRCTTPQSQYLAHGLSANVL